MKTYKANEEVKGGFYWNKETWEIKVVNGKSGTLDGDEFDSFIKVPAAALVGLAPLLGAVLVMFLPFVGFWFTTGVIIDAIYDKCKNFRVIFLGHAV